MPLRLARYGVPLAETAPAGLAAAGIEPVLLPPAPAVDVVAGARDAGAAPDPQRAAAGEQRRELNGTSRQPQQEPEPDLSPWFEAPQQIEYHGGYNPNYDPAEQYERWYEEQMEAEQYELQQIQYEELRIAAGVVVVTAVPVRVGADGVELDVRPGDLLDARGGGGEQQQRAGLLRKRHGGSSREVCLQGDLVALAQEREAAAPTPPVRTRRGRPGAALAAAEHVRRDVLPALRVQNTAGTDERVPPAGGGMTGLRRSAAMTVAGECVQHQDRVRAQEGDDLGGHRAVLEVVEDVVVGPCTPRRRPCRGGRSPTRVITHRLPLTEAPTGYDLFKIKKDHCEKVVLTP
jgi:hypothetical protein